MAAGGDELPTDVAADETPVEKRSTAEEERLLTADVASRSDDPSPSVLSSEPDEADPVNSGRHPHWSLHLTWTARQRSGMVLILCLVVALFGWRWWHNRAYISDPQPKPGARAAELADQLNPNTATWQELLAVPTLGEKRAKAIVAYREDWKRRHPGDIAFKERFDLAAVTGIGASMIETIAPYLAFPAAATTRPAAK